MSRFLEYIEENVDEATMVPPGLSTKHTSYKDKGTKWTPAKDIDKKLTGLLNTSKGWIGDIIDMSNSGNFDGALETLKNLKTKVLKDLEKELKAAQIAKGLKSRKL